MGSGYNSKWLQGTQDTNAVTAATEAGHDQATKDTASIQANAVMDGNLKQYLATLDSNKTELTIQSKAIDARLEEIRSNERVEMTRIREVEVVGAEARMIAAQAQQTTADAKYLKEVNRHDEEVADMESGTTDYWYG